MSDEITVRLTRAEAGALRSRASETERSADAKIAAALEAEPEEARSEDCPDCEGDGLHFGTHEDCDTCDGTGKAETGHSGNIGFIQHLQTSDEGAGSGNAPPSHGESADRASVGASAADPPERGSTPSSEELETDHPPIPDEAVIAALSEGWPGEGPARKGSNQFQFMARVLTAAAPYIRASERERIEQEYHLIPNWNGGSDRLELTDDEPETGHPGREMTSVELAEETMPSVVAKIRASERQAIRERVEGLAVPQPVEGQAPSGRAIDEIYNRALDDCLRAIEGGEE